MLCSMEAPPLPAPEEIALLEPFERLGLDRIALVGTGGLEGRP